MQTPKPPNSDTANRWSENRKRRRMLEGAWEGDLRRRIATMVTGRRAASWGDPASGTSKNLASSIINKLSTLYDRPPSPLNEAEGASETMRGILGNAGHWQLMQGFAPLVIGLREGLVMVDVVANPVSGVVELLTRTTPADLVHVEAHPDAPDVPYRVFEYRIRPDSKGEPVWSRDAWDISDRENPFFEIQDEDGKPWQGSRIEGEEYLARWSYASGVPFVPGEWFHAQRTGKLTDCLKGNELFSGALSVAALWLYWQHIVVDCAFPQRYLSNGRPVGAASHEGEGAPFLDMDPTSILVVEPVEPGIGVILGQFAAGGDPMVIGQSIRDWSSELATNSGITPTDLERATGDARSGFAIALSQEGLRSAQRNWAMSFERHDSSILSKVAAMATRSGLADLPDTGWRVEYSGIPLSLSERGQRLAELESLMNANIISRVQLLSEFESIPLSEARRRLEESQTDIARFRA